MKVYWNKTDISLMADLNGDYRKLDNLLSDTEKKELEWNKGIARLNYEKTKKVLMILFPFLTDEQIVLLIYKGKTISQIL